jgi:hypothetical protein
VVATRPEASTEAKNEAKIDAPPAEPRP